MSLGKRMRDLRVARGLTQADLAEPYYTGAYVSTVEAGRRRPSDKALAHFAQRLETDVDELLTGRPRGLVTELELGLAEARRMVSAGKTAEAEARFADIAKQAKKTKLEPIETRAIWGLGLCKERLEKPADAITLYEQSRARGGPEITPASIDAICGEARCHQLLGDIRLAIHILESAVVALEQSRMEDPSALLRLHAGLVAAYFDAGLYDRSYTAAEEALRLAPKVDESERLAWMYINSAWALHHRGRVREAQETLLRAEHLFQDLELREELGQARLARGMMLSRSGKGTAAKKEIEAAAATFAEVGSRVNEARALNELGRLERLAGKIDRANEHLRRAIRVLEPLDYPGLIGWSHRELGLTLAASDTKAAEKEFMRSLDYYGRADEVVEQAITYRCLGELRDQIGDHSGACEAYRMGIRALEPSL